MPAITNDHLAFMLKAAAWERAKGALREVVAIEGAKSGGIYMTLQDEIVKFIQNFEQNGYHE